MTQTVPATAALGPGKTGLTIGLRVLNLDGTEYAAFSTTGVSETSTLGTYRKASGVACPDAGAYIVWGVSGTDYAEATVEPITALSDIQTRLPAALIDGRMDSSIGAMATDVLTEDAVKGDASEKIAGAVRAELATELARIDIAISDAWDEVREDHTAEGSFGALSEYIPSSTATASAVRIELATELAHLDADVSSAGGGLTAQETRDAMKLAPTAGTPAAGSVDAHLDSLLVYGAGTGTGTYSDTVTDGADPLDNVLVQLSTDAAGTNMVYRVYTAANGTFTMRPDPGTYYVWFELAGYSFTQGAQVVVT